MEESGQNVGMSDPVTVEGNPDVPSTLLHFTGRPRAGAPLPAGRPVSAEHRLNWILTEGWLRAAQTFGTTAPVICLSELSDLAIRRQLARGFTVRGPYEPWALLLRKDLLVQAGARPVWYVDSSEWAATETLQPRLRDRRVRSVPGGAVDWMHEREWRICFGEWPQPGQVFGYQIVPGLIVATIVGRAGWRPSGGTSWAGSARWLWNGSDLVGDGNL